VSRRKGKRYLGRQRGKEEKERGHLPAWTAMVCLNTARPPSKEEKISCLKTSTTKGRKKGRESSKSPLTWRSEKKNRKKKRLD